MMQHVGANGEIMDGGRRPFQEVLRDHRRIVGNDFLVSMLEAIPDGALLLDAGGQLLAINRRLSSLLQGRPVDELIGLRPGEALGCSFASDGDDGCGSSRWCAHCGALQAIVQAREGERQVLREVTLFIDRQTILEVEVAASPVRIDDQTATLCVFRDLSAEKRRQMLERVFFHDIMNTLGGLKGVAELLRHNDIIPPEDVPRYREWLLELTEQLVDEIDQQRKLLAAERGEFRPEMTPFAVAHLLEQVRQTYANHTVAEGRLLRVTPFPDLVCVSDLTILRRILGNLVKNALEAVAVGEEVVLSVVGTDDSVTFVVQNPGCIPDEIQRQLFSRSVSTKAANGRGVGTYSAKLFTERYLGGTIAFASSAAAGTSFLVTVPRNLPCS